MENQYLRLLNSWRFDSETTVPHNFVSHICEEILQSIAIKGYKKADKVRLLQRQLHQLICAGLNNAVVADCRSTSDPATRKRNGLWDSLQSGGWLICCTGSEWSGMTTRYRATPKLLSLRDVWTEDLLNPRKLVRNSRQLSRPLRNALVVIQTSDEESDGGRKALPFSDFPDHANELRDAEDRIERINDRNATHTWRLHVNGISSEPSFRLRQVHVSWPRNGTRLYTYGTHSAQNLSKNLRSQIQIDNYPVAELDYSGMMLRLLYHHFVGIAGPGGPDIPDIYNPCAIFPEVFQSIESRMEHGLHIRNLVKRATLICINCKSREKAHLAIGKSIFECEWREKPSFKVALDSLGSAKPVIELVRRIESLHNEASQYFFQSRGLELMTIESDIMFDILDTITAAGKPALGIHDAVLCIKHDEGYVKDLMQSVYRRHLGFDPVIS